MRRALLQNKAQTKERKTTIIISKTRNIIKFISFTK